MWADENGEKKVDLKIVFERVGDPHVHLSNSCRIGFPLFSEALSLIDDQQFCCAHDIYVCN
jgi:hypothetical protein